MKATIIYDSQTNHTKKMAELIQKGMEKSLDVKVFSIDEVDETWLNDSQCLIIGSPTYYVDLSSKMKSFLETLGKYQLSGKLGGAFSTAGFVYGGGEMTIENILKHLLFYGMMVYSSGCSTNPPIHLGPIAINNIKETETIFEAYGQRMAKQTLNIFKGD